MNLPTYKAGKGHDGGSCSTTTSGKSGGGCSSGSCGTKKGEPGDPQPSYVKLNIGMAKAEKSRPTIADLPFTPTTKYPQGLFIGLDVGSTTVKFVVVDPITDEILHKDYQRHDTKQPEKCIEMLTVIEQKFADVPRNAFRVFMTGSGGSSIGKRIGARFVQEVNAVSLAVEKLYPDVQSVVELGGQDAKIIVFKTDESTGKKKKIPSMNDKCAGGTGAVIDKINAKLKIPSDQLCEMGYAGIKLHPVAGKCGVFAETDINGLQKQGVPPDELMASLFESIIQQNLAVLTRGHTLRPQLLLLGGPNCYIKGMRDCWRHNVPLIWKERHVEFDESKPIDELIVVPENAQYFAALGAVEFAKLEVQDNANFGVYRGFSELEWYITVGRIEEKKAAGGAGLCKDSSEMEIFKQKYKKEPWSPTEYPRGTHIQAFVGLDGGSTSTKGVLMDLDKNVIAKCYQLSKGNPIEDTMDIFSGLQKQVEDQGCTLEILGVGTTGYAKDILRDVIKADVALVETVAHTQAGLHFYPGTDVIVDVGGQDIKLIILKNGQVKDFKLNTQCSAGNGYFLQSTAQGFGFPVEQFADIAFSAQAMPNFGYGCAVFMQSDIVDFQRQGWAPNEIMAGLCDVLPKNIWLYVSQIPNIAKLGSRFVLQGGTQHNLAAVKSQVDFISSRFRGMKEQPEIIVHKFCGEAGAIGCAVEVHRLYTEKDMRTSFIGMDRVSQIQFRTTRSEATRCYFCKNKCLRTFIDVKTGDDTSPPLTKGGQGGVASLSLTVIAAPAPKPTKSKSKVPLQGDEQRLIIATCEKGTVEDVADMRDIKAGLDALKKSNPNFAEITAREAFAPTGVAVIADPLPKVTLVNILKKKEIERRIELMKNRENIRIGMPRVLNMYSMAPWFMAYFQSLGIRAANLVWSDYTSEELYKEGAKRGAIDPCFPSKIGIPHVHNLLYHKHADKPLNYIFFPMIDCMPTFLENIQSSRACPTVSATPEAVKAAFTKESDLFAEMGTQYLDTFVNFSEPGLLARQMFDEFKDKLGLSRDESDRACRIAWDYYDTWYADLRKQARELLDRLEKNDEIGVVLLTRPYHHDPGVCHEIPDEFQKLGISVFTMDVLPRDPDLLERLFGEEVRRGDFASTLSIEDVWKNAYSENTNRKIWAAKFAARHPNLVALELSSFKCGHDAPIYSVIEEIIETSGTPYFCFKDIDENKPTGSIKIRIETIAYFLRRHRDKLVRNKTKLAQIEARLAELEQELRATESHEHADAHVQLASVVGV